MDDLKTDGATGIIHYFSDRNLYITWHSIFQLLWPELFNSKHFEWDVRYGYYYKEIVFHQGKKHKNF